MYKLIDKIVDFLIKKPDIFNDVEGVFKPPVKKYYIGKLTHGTPYFYPMKFSKYIIDVRKLKLREPDKYEEYVKNYTHLAGSDQAKFSNLPMVRRSKDWVKKIFGTYYWIQVGYPISIKKVSLGWKDKWNSPRFEWGPAFQIYFFKFQFCIFWFAPGEPSNNDKYYEMMLWYVHYCNKDIKEAEKTWGWTDYETKKSTWDNSYLIELDNE